MRVLLDAGLMLTYFDEPTPGVDTPVSRAAAYCRVPWFVVMEWLKPVAGHGEPAKAEAPTLR
jgi:hypothetical protein